MGRNSKNDDEKAVKISISIPRDLYDKIVAVSEKPPKKKLSRFIAELISKSLHIYP